MTNEYELTMRMTVCFYAHYVLGTMPNALYELPSLVLLVFRGKKVPSVLFSKRSPVRGFHDLFKVTQQVEGRGWPGPCCAQSVGHGLGVHAVCEM